MYEMCLETENQSAKLASPEEPAELDPAGIQPKTWSKPANVEPDWTKTDNIPTT